MDRAEEAASAAAATSAAAARCFRFFFCEIGRAHV